MVPLTEHPHFAAGQQHGQTVKTDIGPYFATTDHGIIDAKDRHWSVVTNAVEVFRTSNYHTEIIDDLYRQVSGCRVNQSSIESRSPSWPAQTQDRSSRRHETADSRSS